MVILNLNIDLRENWLTMELQGSDLTMQWHRQGDKTGEDTQVSQLDNILWAQGDNPPQFKIKRP